MKQRNKKSSWYLFDDGPKRPLIWILLVASFLLHGTHYLILPKGSEIIKEKSPKKRKLISYKIVPKKKELIKKPEEKRPKKISEADLAETKPPKEAKYFGKVDHATDKETKTAKMPHQDKLGKAGFKGNGGDKTRIAKIEKKKPTPPKPKQKIEPLTRPSKVAQKPAPDSKKPAARNLYENLLQKSYASLAGREDAGYQEYLDEALAIGDRVDINTSKYRYIGYFSSMRRSILLVWAYPEEAARRGIAGTVGIEWTIKRNGDISRIKVLESSGYESLDLAIIDAIQLAAPFSPLPDSFGKEKLTITGSFSYTQSYGSYAH